MLACRLLLCTPVIIRHQRRVLQQLSPSPGLRNLDNGGVLKLGSVAEELKAAQTLRALRLCQVSAAACICISVEGFVCARREEGNRMAWE